MLKWKVLMSIELELQKVRDDIINLDRERKDLNSYSIVDNGEEAERNQQLSMIIAKTNLKYVQLDRLVAAKKRVSEGDYGYCQCCGEDIHPDRLKMDVAAENCSDCQLIEPQRYKHSYRHPHIT